VVHPLFVDGKVHGQAVPGGRRVCNLIGRGQRAAVPRCGGDRARVHQRHHRKLALGRLRAFAVFEVPGGVTDREAAARRHVARAEAGAAERGLQKRARLQQGLGDAAFCDLKLHRHAGRVNGQGERTAAHRAAGKDHRGFGEIIVQAARAARDHRLVHENPAIFDLARQAARRKALPHLGLPQDVAGVFHERADRQRARRVEGQRDHRLDFGKVHFDQRVVMRALVGGERLEVVRTARAAVEILNGFVGLPHGGEARRLGGHHVQAQPEIDGQVLYAGACELQDLVFDEAACVHRLAERQRRVVGADARPRGTGQVDQHDLRILHVVGVLEKLLDQLRPALAHAHRAQRAVAGVAVRAQDHAAGFGHRLAGVLVDDGEVRRDVDAAVLDRR